MRGSGVRGSDWTDEEDKLIIDLQQRWGNRWSSIAGVGVVSAREA